MPVNDANKQPVQLTAIVTFRLGRQIYALPISPIRQIIEMVSISPLPQTNHNIAGVINFHGAAVPVIRLRTLLGLAEEPMKLHTPIILLNHAERLVGLVVDEVLDVVERPAEEVINPEKILVEEMGEIPLLQGLIQTNEGSILLLNPQNIFQPLQSGVLLEAMSSLAQKADQNRTEAVVKPKASRSKKAAVVPAAVAETAPETVQEAVS